MAEFGDAGVSVEHAGIQEQEAAGGANEGLVDLKVLVPVDEVGQQRSTNNIFQYEGFKRLHEIAQTKICNLNL